MVRNPGPLLDGLLRVTRAAFSPWLAAPLLVAVLAMQVLVAVRLGDLAGQTVRLLGQPGPLLLAGVASWLIAALHELAHGVAARRYGVPVLEIGVRWLPPLVMPYCRTDGYLHLPRRRSQAVIAGAGVLVELALLLPAFAAWWWGPPGATSDALAALVLCVSAHALLNVVPVPPLDGYRLLSHALGVTDYARQTGIYSCPAGPSRPARRRLSAPAPGSRTSFTRWCCWRPSPRPSGWCCGRRTPGWAGPAWRPQRGRSHSSRRHCRCSGCGRPTPSRRLRAAGAAVRDAAAEPARSSGPSTAARRAGTVGRTGTPRANVIGSGPPALVLEGIVKEYGGRRAVDGVRLEVGTGEFLGLLGPNGAGKTTLVEIAVGLRQADAGTVSVLGECPWPRRTALLRRIGVQTQSAAFFVRLTAREHLRDRRRALRARPRGRGGRAPPGRPGPARPTTRADRLSGGQQQRLAIAAALVHDPELIFLDEPTASLDPQARRELWSVLRDLHADGRTIVYTTHHIDEAEALCDAGGDHVGRIGGRLRCAVRPDRVGRAADPHRGPRQRPLPGRRAHPARGRHGQRRGPVAWSSRPMTALPSSPELDALAGLRGVQTRTPTLEDVYLDRIRSERAP